MSPTNTPKHEIITRISFGAFALSLFTLGCDPADEPIDDDERLAAEDEDDEALDDLAATPANDDEPSDDELDDEPSDSEPGDDEPTLTEGEHPALASRDPGFGLTAAVDAIGYAWTGVWFSEETPPSTCPGSNVVTGVACSGWWCNDMQLECNGNYSLGATSWTPWFSEEGTNYRICGGTSYVSGMACSGFWCDNLSLQCTTVNTTNPNVHSCAWSGFFSEEDPPFYAPVGTAIKGVQCNGGYCDQLRYYYCPI